MLVTSIALIVCGVLAAANFIAARQPNAANTINKLTPYQGWIGLVVCIWGVWTVISAVLNIGWVHHAPIAWITYLGVGVLEFALGFLLGFGLISQYALSRNASAASRGQELRAQLIPYQIKLGFVGILLGAWCLLASFMYHL